jgi:hypothetical protein
MVEVADGVKVRAFRDGQCYRIATLPEKRAGSLFTRSIIANQEADMNQTVLDELTALAERHNLDQGWLTEAIASADGVNRTIEEEGLITRDAPEGSEEVPDESEPADDAQPDPEPPVAPVIELDDSIVDVIVERMGSEASTQRDELAQAIDGVMAQLTAVGNQVAGIARRVEALEADEEVRRQLYQEDMPAMPVLRVTHRPSVANDPANEGGSPEPAVPFSEQAEAVTAALNL